MVKCLSKFFLFIACIAASPEVITFERYFLSIFIFNKKFITFELGLGALDKKTIFFELFFNLSTASIAFGLSIIPLCITPHKSIMKVSYFLNISDK